MREFTRNSIDAKLLIPDFDALLSVPVLTYDLPKRKIFDFLPPSSEFTLPQFMEDEGNSIDRKICEYEDFRKRMGTGYEAPYISHSQMPHSYKPMAAQEVPNVVSAVILCAAIAYATLLRKKFL